MRNLFKKKIIEIRMDHDNTNDNVNTNDHTNDHTNDNVNTNDHTNEKTEDVLFDRYDIERRWKFQNDKHTEYVEHWYQNYFEIHDNYIMKDIPIPKHTSLYGWYGIMIRIYKNQRMNEPKKSLWEELMKKKEFVSNMRYLMRADSSTLKKDREIHKWIKEQEKLYESREGIYQYKKIAFDWKQFVSLGTYS